MLMLFVVFLIVAYLLGSLSSGIIVCKLMGLPDPRTQGSGNIGATNVLRTGGKQAAALVLVCDILKGFIPVMLAYWFGLTHMSLGLVGVAAVIGHIYPIFAQFHGGKGVATAVGVWFALSIWFGLIIAIIWVGVLIVTRYASVASIVVAVAAPFLGTLLTNNVSYFIPISIISLLLIWRHYDNITRLKEGTEPKTEIKM